MHALTRLQVEGLEAWSAQACMSLACCTNGGRRILDKTAESDWCHTFKIDTAGQKLDISLKGKLVGSHACLTDACKSERRHCNCRMLSRTRKCVRKLPLLGEPVYCRQV